MKFSVIFLAITNVMISQGEWDIHYEKISSDLRFFINKDFFIDIKNNENDIFDEEASNHDLMFKSDSAICILNNKKVMIKEEWLSYVDHGVVSDQAYKVLEGEYQNKVIKKIRLKSIDSKSIKLNGVIENEIVSFEIMVHDAKLALVSYRDYLKKQ